MPSNESVFDRLYRQSTAASRAASIRSSPAPHASSKPSTSSHASHRQTKISTSENKNVDSGTGTSREHTPKQQVARTYTGSWRITSTSKYDTSSNKTVTNLGPISLNVSAELGAFDQGEIGAEQFARSLITALFDRDHMKGRHWDYDPPSASPLPSDDDNILKFQAEKAATWDWKDIYSVATAKGTIIFFMEKSEIRVEDYSYYAAG